jgi:hypothetical protein
VEFSSDLQSNAWSALPGGSVQGDSHDATVADPDGFSAPMRIYHVRRD